MSRDIDVLIIGGGPTGTMLGLELAFHGVSFRIVDKEPVRSDKSRALVVQQRTQELFNRHGAAHDLISRGQLARSAVLFVNRKQVTSMDLGDLGFTDTEFPTPLAISQAETERFLDDCLAKYDGKKVERPVVAKDIVQDADGVTVTLSKTDGGDEIVRAQYVVGCDGAHSVVRHASKMKFEGAPYPQGFILADCHLSNSNLPRETFLLCFGRGLMALFPLKGGLVRLVVSRPDDKGDEQPVLDDFVPLFERFTPPGSGRLHDPVWLARFHLHHRGVDRYRDERLFVAGDAAHIHSPAGGQGMNTGIQDAINLGWKLALVVRWEKDDSFLDSYSAERLPIGRKLLTGTDRIFSWGTWANPIWEFFRNLLVPLIVPRLVSTPQRRANLFRFLSEFGIRYRRSPIVGTATGFSGPIQGGDRLSDGKIQQLEVGETTLQRLCIGASHHLVLFSGIGNDAVKNEELQNAEDRLFETAKGEVQVHIIYGAASVGKIGYLDADGSRHRQYGLAKGGYVYVRPDGYVGHIGPLVAFDDFLEFLKL